MCGFYVRMRVRCIGILARCVIVSFRLRVTDCMGIFNRVTLSIIHARFHLVTHFQ